MKWLFIKNREHSTIKEVPYDYKGCVLEEVYDSYSQAKKRLHNFLSMRRDAFACAISEHRNKKKADYQ